jgi:hypothetical protein
LKPPLHDRKMLALAKILYSTDISPRIVIETGTLRGELAVRLPELFPVVHTIELSKELYDRHPDDDRVCWHFGDSRVWLRELDFQEPVLFYLDAHYFKAKSGKSNGVAGAYDFPLWSELDIIAKRPFRDIVVVDDVHSFNTVLGEDYGDWEHVTPESLAKRLDRVTRQQTVDDMHAMWRTECPAT